MLDYVVERKRCDDLVSSVRDQRYAAQKYRMRQSRLRNLFYLLEGDPDITCEPAVLSRWLLLQLQHNWVLADWGKKGLWEDVSSQLLLHGGILFEACSPLGCWSSRTPHTGGVLSLLRSDVSGLLRAGMGPSVTCVQAAAAVGLLCCC